MRRPKKKPILAVIGAALLGSLLIVGYAAIQWWASIETGTRLAHPVNSEEASFLNHWRCLHRLPEAPMQSVPFKVEAPCPRPCVTSIRLQNTANGILHNVWFYSADMPNFYSARTLSATAIRNAKTPTEKVLALWNLFPRYYVHQSPLTDSMLCSDPPTLFAVLGGAQCNNASDVLETLCQLEGIETRRLGVEYYGGRDETITHSTLEAHVGDRWIFLDPDGHAIYKRADGAWASAQDLSAESSPVAAHKHGYYDPALYARAFSEGRVIVHEQPDDRFRNAKAYTNPAKFRFFRHLMRYDLLPGASVTLYPLQHSKFCGDYGEKAPPSYCNGALTWELRPDHLMRDNQGLLHTNLRCLPGQETFDLARKRKSSEAAVIVPVVSPYLLVGGVLEGDVEGEMEVFLQRFPLGTVPLPEEWQPLGNAQGQFTLSFDKEIKHPCFGFAIKLSVPKSGATVRRLQLEAVLQLSPLALPRLREGDNLFVLYTERDSTRMVQHRRGSDGAAMQFSDGLKLSFSFTPARNERELLSRMETGTPKARF